VDEWMGELWGSNGWGKDRGGGIGWGKVAFSSLSVALSLCLSDCLIFLSFTITYGAIISLFYIVMSSLLQFLQSC
jgi:hypothetical protein